MDSKIDFKGVAVTPNSRNIRLKKDANQAVIVFRDGIYALYKGDLYSIEFDITKYTKLYSLPTNNAHEEWTERTVKSIRNVVLKHWSPFKPKDKVKGEVINNKFVIR